MRRMSLIVLIFVFVALGPGPVIGGQESNNDPLSSWNDGSVKQAIVAFVAKVTQQGSPDFVPPAERIATFDNDGTLWCEQPMYVQLAFVLDRVKELRAKNPEWKNKQPFKAVLEKDFKALAAQGEKGAAQLIAATHAGMSSEEFNRIAGDWIASARHPKFKRPYTEMVYQPMLEVARLSARQRLQDFHRFGRRRGFHASMDGKSLRHPARAGGRQHGQAQIRIARRQAGADETRRNRPRRRRAGKTGGHPEIYRPPAASLRSATPTAISRCCNTPPPATARASC